MRLPRAVLLLEIVGIIFLLLAWLSLRGYLTLPTAIVGTKVATIMVFIGMGLMLPAAAVMFWRIAQHLVPQRHNKSPRESSSNRIKEKHDDADY